MADRLATNDFFLPPFVFPEVFAQHGLNQSGSDGVDPDSLGAKLQGIALAHHDHGSFGHAVKQPMRLWTQTRNGSNIDDRAGAAIAHARGYQLDQAKHAFKVHLNHLVELAFVKIETETVGDVGGGIVDQDIDASELARG